MCGRFVNRISEMPEWSELLKIWPGVNPSYNVSPSQTIAAFRSPAGKAMRWGLIPHWAKEFSSDFSPFNARAASAHEKPAFRDAWDNAQRCLIPMLGYYEWKGPKGSKQPYFIQPSTNNGLVMAGLYDCFRPAAGADSDKTGKEYSCTILTRPADKNLQDIHGRMPVMLTPDTAAEWLNIDTKLAQDFLMQTKAPELEFYPVSKAVGNVLTNGKKLIEPLIEPFEEL